MVFLIIVAILLIIIGIGVLCNFIMNRSFALKTYVIRSRFIPKGFDGFVITQVSDLHNRSFGENNESLISAIKDTNPDMIAVTGDIIDGNYNKCDNAIKLIESISKTAPVYFVEGNHEHKDPEDFERLKKVLADNNALLLFNSKTTISRNGDTIELMGLSDISHEEDPEIALKRLWEMCENSNSYIILLSHHPEIMEYFAECKIDLALTGHTHAGQFRIPIIGSFYIPNQGFFPKYDVGRYRMDDTVMIISSGLGQTVLTRIFCKPQLVKIVLKSECEENR